VKLGILGGGQLGRMLALAAHDLDIAPSIYSPQLDCSAAVTRHQVGAWDDRGALERFAADADVVTYELEQLPAATLEVVLQTAKAAPSLKALKRSQDRLLEKQLFDDIGLPTAPWAPVSSPDDVARAAETVGFPCLLKTRYGGYDGKGQAACSTVDELDAAFRDFNVPSIVERRLDLIREVSVIAARSWSGELRWYDPVENHHEGGILRVSRAPATDVSSTDLERLSGFASALLERLDYVGVLALELFETADGWLGNEFAPRVHNSGHWTTEGAETSQFENHVRAVCDLPLGSTRSRGLSAMVNLIGRTPPLAELAAVDGARIHLYGKTDRPGRKVGHVTVCAEDRAELERRIAAVQATL